MGNVMTKMKWFIIFALIVLVAGMTMLGLYGFNNTVDYSKSYEVRVRLEQNIDNHKQTLQNTADDYFASKGISIVSCQKEDDGVGIIYKLTDKVSNDKIAELQQKINEKLDGLETGNNVTVTINQVYENSFLQPLNILIAYGIALVVIFLYMLIMNKLASAVAVVLSSIFSVLMFVAVVALTRIPAAPYFELMAMMSGVLGAVLSVITVGGYREKLKGAEKVSAKDIAIKVGKIDSKKYLFAFIVSMVGAVAVAAFLLPYMMVLGGQIAIAGAVAVPVAYFVTPLIWMGIKGKKLK